MYIYILYCIHIIYIHTLYIYIKYYNIINTYGLGHCTVGHGITSYPRCFSMRDTTDGDFFAGVLFGQHVSRLFIQTGMIDTSLFDHHAHKGWVEPQPRVNWH